MAFESPHAVILDDGELTDVRSMLTDLGVPFVDELPKGDGPQRAIPLLVTTSARARGPGAALPANYLHLVVCDATDESTADVPCDFLLQRPIEAAVLRLLTQRAGYEGPERRRMLRVVIDGPVGLWVDDREFDAQLAQLSIGGCGLITHEPPEPGGRAILEFSRELTGPRGLRVNGRVLSVRDVKGSEPPRHDVSIAFD
ncbi:MAG: PilZ domain-containing protein, partial [Myxococcales bacterium]|nr:PilZ domain-containing protein [Myxococcales bacterium]